MFLCQPMRIQEEITELEKRFSLAPDSRLFLPLADALRRAGELERSIRLCREGLVRYPDFTSARILLAECLAALGELEEAESIFEEVARTDAGNVMVQNSLANVAEQRGDQSRSGQLSGRVQPEVAGEEVPEIPAGQEQADYPARRDTAGAAGPSTALDAKISSGLEKEAPEEELTDFGSADPGSIFLTHTLADIYRLQGHYGKAYEIYLKLLEAATGDPELERKLAEVRSRLEGGSLRTASPTGKTGSGRAESRPGVAPPDEDDFETRIDAIFHFLLGEEPAAHRAGSAASTGMDSSPGGGPGESSFIDNLENWISGIHHGEAG